MKTYQLNNSGRLQPDDKDEVVKILKRGGVVVVPTDTSYGLSAVITKPKGVEQVFSLKARSKKMVTPIVVRSMAQAREYGHISGQAARLWQAFLPGALTLVVNATKKINLITAADNSIAIRRIATPVVNQLLKYVSAPLTITSANRTGKKNIYSLPEFLRQYKGKRLPDAFLDAGVLRKSKPSTSVKLTDKTAPGHSSRRLQS